VPEGQSAERQGRSQAQRIAGAALETDLPGLENQITKAFNNGEALSILVEMVTIRRTEER
jgi:hypothetical protein